MLGQKATCPNKQMIVIKEADGDKHLYGYLRRGQKRLAEGRVNRLSEFSQRDTFQKFAWKLTKKFFGSTVKKKKSVVEHIHRAYVDWLVLAPLISSRKWLPKPGMHRGHYLSWIRRVCNKGTRQWFFAKHTFDLPPADEMARRAAINACEIIGVRDNYWLEEEFEFLAWLAHTDGLKARLARWIILPWVFLDEDLRWDEVLHFRLPGWEKEVARAGKRGSSSYLRLGHEVWIFASEKLAEQVDLPWKDLRKEKADVLDYTIWYEERVVTERGKKRLAGGVQISLQKEVISRVRAEAKAIAHRDIPPGYKLYLLNNLAKSFISTHQYAISAGKQFIEVGRFFKDLVQRRIAPTLGPEAVKKGIYPSAGDIDRSLYLRKLNPFWDTKEPGEEEYVLWWTPYQP